MSAIFLVSGDLQDDNLVYKRLKERLDSKLHHIHTSQWENHEISSAQIIILLNQDYKTALAINEKCRKERVAFIWCSRNGAFISAFCDPGHDVLTVNQQGIVRPDDKPLHVGSLSWGDSLLVTCVREHYLRLGDSVKICTVPSGLRVSGKEFKVRPVSATQFYVDSPEVLAEEQFEHATVTLASRNTAEYKPLGVSALNPAFASCTGGCNSVCNKEQHAAFICSAQGYTEKSVSDVIQTISWKCTSKPDPKSVLKVWNTMKIPTDFAAGCDSILSAIVASLLNSLETRRFLPLNQWLHLNTFPHQDCEVRNSSWKEETKHIAILGLNEIGLELVHLLAQEENYFHGKLYLGSNAVVDKSICAQDMRGIFDSSCDLNSETLVAEKLKSHYTHVMHVETFDCENCQDHLQNFDLVIVAGGSYDFRRNVGSLCQIHCKAMIDCGSDSYIGHVQSIVPKMTIAHNCNQDPSEQSVPYCIVKSFPYASSHCITWATDKADTLLKQKPLVYNQFISDNDQDFSGRHKEALTTFKMIQLSCTTWHECITFARKKFEKYFPYKALVLLDQFPPSSTTKDGQPYWSYPKKQPTSNMVYSNDDPLHVKMIFYLAKCWAHLWKIQVDPSECNVEFVKTVVKNVLVSMKLPGTKNEVHDDETLTKEEVRRDIGTEFAQIHQETLTKEVTKRRGQLLDVNIPQHLIQVTVVCLARLRAAMYNITMDQEDEDIVSESIGNVACRQEASLLVANLTFLEAQRILSGSSYPSNWWISFVDQPSILRSDSVLCQKKHVGKIEFTLWDKISIRGSSEWTLQDFLRHMDSLEIDVAMVVHGSKIVYAHFMALHKTRLTKLMTQVLTRKPDVKTVLLNVTTKSDEDIPPVLYQYE